MGRAHNYPKRKYNFLVFGAPASLIGSALSSLLGSGPLPEIETFVTFCGMVGLQAMVLGRLRMKTLPSKSVCSILPIAICGPGLYGAPCFLRLTPWRVFLSAFRSMTLVSPAASDTAADQPSPLISARTL